MSKEQESMLQLLVAWQELQSIPSYVERFRSGLSSFDQDASLVEPISRECASERGKQALELVEQFRTSNIHPVPCRLTIDLDRVSGSRGQAERNTHDF
jgi:hypothetical protein